LRHVVCAADITSATRFAVSAGLARENSDAFVVPGSSSLGQANPHTIAVVGFDASTLES